MGCRMLAAIDGMRSQSVLDNVPVWFEEWEGLLSRFREDSELSEVNRRAGTPTVVSQVFADVFELALQAERLPQFRR